MPDPLTFRILRQAREKNIGVKKMKNNIMTKYELRVIEYDPSGYYYSKYVTEQVVIADNLEDAKKKAIERTPVQSGHGGWKQSVKVVRAEDIVIASEEVIADE